MAAGAPRRWSTGSIDASIFDEGLSRACGFDIVMRARGTVTNRVFEEGRTGPQQVSTFNLVISLSANGKTYDTHRSGQFHWQMGPDGAVVCSISGFQPFAFTGDMKTNTSTGQIFLEPHHSLDPVSSRRRARR